MSEQHQESEGRVQEATSRGDNVGLTLRVRWRKSCRSSRHNLFCRLHPSVARELYELAAAAAAEDGQEDTTTSWRVPLTLSAAVESGVEFLPLCITPQRMDDDDDDERDKQGVSIYCSYNGGNIVVDSTLLEDSNPDDDKVIELSSCLVPDWQQQPWVSVQPLSRLSTTASQVSIQPLNPTHYDLLHAPSLRRRLEHGGFLSQVSVLAPHQILTLCLDDDSDLFVTAHVLTDGLEFFENNKNTPQHSSSTTRTKLGYPWDGSDDEEEEMDDGRPNLPSCFRLIADTKIVVVPPSDSKDTNITPPLRLHPTAGDYSNNHYHHPDSLIHKLLHLPPHHPFRVDCLPTVPQLSALVHPDVLLISQTQQQQQSFKSDNDETTLLAKLAIVSRKSSAKSSLFRNVIVVRVQACDKMPVGCLALNPLLRQQLDLDLWRDAVSLQWLTQLEITQMTTSRLQEVLEHAALKLYRVPITYKDDRKQEAPWVCPELNSCQFLSRQEVHQDTSGSRVPLERLLDPPRSLTTLPICIGVLFQLPWMSDDLSVVNKPFSYRLEIVPNEPDEKGDTAEFQEGVHRILTEAKSEIFLFAKDLFTVLTSVNRERQHSQHPQPIHEHTETGLMVSEESSFDARLPAPVHVLNENIPFVITSSVYLSHQLVTDSFVSNRLFDVASNLLTAGQSLSNEPAASSSRVPHVLIEGAMGSGKTYTAVLLASMAHLSSSLKRVILYSDCRKLKNSRGTRLSTILDELRTVFAAAADGVAGAVVILDNLDEIVPSYESSNGSSDSGAAHTQQVNPALIDQCKTIEGIIQYVVDKLESPTPVTCIATCNHSEGLSPYIRKIFNFHRVIKLPLLSKEDRLNLFKELLEHQIAATNVLLPLKNRRYSVEELHLPDFAKSTVGFRPRDFERIASRVVQLLIANANKGKDVSLIKATEWVLDRYVPLSKLSAGTEEKRSTTVLSDVGGLFNVKMDLVATILRPSKYHRIYSKLKTRLPKGILLFGPPGCGKSYIVPALARECGFPLVMCRGPELLDKYIGASEAKVRELFGRAASVAPCILFLDELDALAPRRGSDTTGVTDRVVNQLLTFLDGVEESSSSTSGTVYVVASSSRPDKIDPALLRPGRLERHLYVGHPTEVDEWNDLLRKIAKRYDVDDSVIQYIESGDMTREIQKVASLNVCFPLTAADIGSLFDSAKIIAAHEILARMEQKEDLVVANRTTIRLDQVQRALQSTKPSLSRQEGLKLQHIFKPFLNDASRNVSIREKESCVEDDPTNRMLRIALR